MKTKIINIFKYSLFAIIPLTSVLLCLIFSVAQGEKNEEIVFGVLLGIAIDLIYSMYLLVANKISKTKKVIVFVFFSLIVIAIAGLVLSNSFTTFGEHTYQSAKDFSEAFLKHNQKELECIAQDILKDKQTSISEYKIAYEIKYDEHEEAVNFEIGSQGMLGGQYWRLVYTEKGNYRGKTEKYTYYEEDGNNIAFAEKINENWYFYWIDYDGREDLSNIK
ncbi:MAG: hypothetical protein IKD04_07265 [Clostridia bacterium]|nr:hypothetical protein [Clostridia bacterium]